MKKIGSILLITTISVSLFLLSSCTKTVTNESVTIQVGGESVSGTYTGVMENGLPSGDGSFASDDQKYVYEGSWSNGVPSGQGHLHFSGCTIHFTDIDRVGIYDGDLNEGTPSGTGKFTSSDGKYVYDGAWSNGVPAGAGHLHNDEYVVHYQEVDRTGAYEGDTVDGIPNGAGIFSAENADHVKYTYTGEWKNGIMNGQGVKEFFADDYNTCTGNFTNGEFDPTFIELIKSYGDVRGENSVSFFVNETAESFITNNLWLFPFTESRDISKYVNFDIGYKEIAKNPDKYSDKLIYMPYSDVIQINEFSTVSSEVPTMSFLIIEDGDYYPAAIFYPGELSDIYEGDRIAVIGLPLDFSSYKNVDGGTTKCPVILASVIGKGSEL